MEDFFLIESPTLRSINKNSIKDTDDDNVNRCNTHNIIFLIQFPQNIMRENVMWNITETLSISDN